VACLAATLGGCGARYARVPLHESPDLRVTLRSEIENGAPRARGFSHPATLSALRAAAVLGRIEIRESGKEAAELRPAMPQAVASELGGVLAEALARADATQEVVVRAKRRERRLGVFTRAFATSFVAFVDAEGRLQVHLADADRELPAGEDGELPEPIAGRGTHAFKVLPGPHIAAIGQRSVAVDWRADTFGTPAPASVGRRRTILMDGGAPRPEDAPIVADEGPLPTDPAVLQALADLENERRAGRVSEVEYQRRRAALLAPAPE
jgi:hypothetical protein